MRYHVDAMRRVVSLKGGLQNTVLDELILRLIDWYVQLIYVMLLIDAKCSSRNDLQCTLLAKNWGHPRRYPAVMLTSGFPTFS